MKKVFQALRNKWAEYLIEIIVIILGILGAYALNNLNDQRIQRIEEKQILHNIHNEFIMNKALLQKKITLGQQSYNSAVEIMGLIGSERPELMKTNLDSLFFSMLPGTGDFLPPNNAINNMIQSGKLSLISNEELINKLNHWQSTIELTKYQEESSDNWITQRVVPLLIEHISMKQMDDYGGFEWTGKSKLKTDYYPLFQSLKFENTLDNMLFGLNRNLNSYKEIDLIISDILSLTEIPK